MFEKKYAVFYYIINLEVVNFTRPITCVSKIEHTKRVFYFVDTCVRIFLIQNCMQFVTWFFVISSLVFELLTIFGLIFFLFNAIRAKKKTILKIHLLFFWWSILRRKSWFQNISSIALHFFALHLNSETNISIFIIQRQSNYFRPWYIVNWKSS